MLPTKIVLRCMFSVVQCYMISTLLSGYTDIAVLSCLIPLPSVRLCHIIQHAASAINCFPLHCIMFVYHCHVWLHHLSVSPWHLKHVLPSPWSSYYFLLFFFHSSTTYPSCKVPSPWQPTITEDYPDAESAWPESLSEVNAVPNISWAHGYPSSYLAWLGSDGQDMKACKFVLDSLHLIAWISSILYSLTRYWCAWFARTQICCGHLASNHMYILRLFLLDYLFMYMLWTHPNFSAIF